ncbi:hypothetical protein PGB90_006032 [Kerria lacca]
MVGQMWMLSVNRCISYMAIFRIIFPAIIMENDTDEVLKLIGMFGDKPVKTAIRVLISPLKF